MVGRMCMEGREGKGREGKGKERKGKERKGKRENVRKEKGRGKGNVRAGMKGRRKVWHMKGNKRKEKRGKEMFGDK